MWIQHVFKILLFFCTLSFLIVMLLIFNYVHEKNQKMQVAKDHAQQETLEVTKQINAIFDELSSIAHTIADDISSGQLQRQELLKRLNETLATTPNLFGIGVAFVPYVNHPQKRLLTPYYVSREDKKQLKKDLLQVFTVPITYFDSTKNSKITTGMVFIDYLSSDIKTLMTSLELGPSGYGFILSEAGVFIAHPIDDYTKNRQTIFHLAESYHDNALRRFAEQAIDGENGVINYIDQLTGQSAWIFYQFIPSTHWSIGVVFFKNILETNSLRQQLIWVCVTVIIFLVLLVMLIFRVDKGRTGSLWKVVIVSSLLLIAGIGFIWYLAQTASFQEQVGSTMIVDNTGLEKFLLSQSADKEEFFYVPTGIFIESIKFPDIDVNDVTFTGYIWQKYTDNIHDGLSRGFSFPEAQSSEMIESYRLKKGRTEIIGWNFNAVIRHQFYHAKYPLDRRELNLKIVHKDFDQNVILIPDLEAYKITNPTVRPGIKQEVVLPGWLIFKSFFNYRSNYENTNLGIENYAGYEDFSHLFFTIFLKREFLAPFITNVLPLVIISSILFSLLMWLGKTSTFIRSLIGLFFGILLAHIRLRGSIMTPELLYLEFFYLVIYCSLLFTTISFFLYRYRISIGYYRDGLISKLLFWPMILVSSFIITVIVFYI
ncbi:MAG: hypothetical protein KAH84_13090 [Thiomargarita sp.]|nr:hypothetical protein [Thiomargarita sp.]